ncbi:PrsW family intramembrane metalloprotease [bacterium]|nr:PrsW family intramembrane metalloprotease [bacterium]
MSNSDSEAIEQWWVSIRGRTRGPFSTKEVGQLLSAGEITNQTYVCPAGEDAWKQISALAALEDIPQAWGPPPPPDANPVSESPAPTSKSSTPSHSNLNEEKILNHLGSLDVSQAKTLLYDHSGAPRIWPLLAITVVPYLLVLTLPWLGNPPSGPWGLALFSCLIAGGLLWYYIRPDRQDTILGIGAFAFTTLLAIPILLAFQETAHLQVAEQVPFNLHPTKLLPYLIHHVQQAYVVVLNPELQSQTSFFGHLFYMFISVALCEEAIKLAPVIILLAINRSYPFRSVILAGACSGFGFGIAEAVFYHYYNYTPETSSLTLYLTRFMAIPWLHASWTTLSAAIYYSVIQGWKTPTNYGPFIILLVLCPTILSIFCSMVLHTFYNVLSFRIGLLEIVPLLLSVAVAYWVFYDFKNPGRTEALAPNSSE